MKTRKMHPGDKFLLSIPLIFVGIPMLLVVIWPISRDVVLGIIQAFR